jgi:signal transduction histidine kinase
MRSVPIPRDRLPYLAAWLLVIALVLVVQGVVAPISYRSEVDLSDVAVSDRDAVREALAGVRLTPTHLAWYWLVVGWVTASVYVALGWLLVRRGRPAGFSTWLAIVMAAFTAATYPPGIDDLLPGRELLQALVLGLTMIAVSGFFILPLVFPDGRFVPRWTILLSLYLVASIASLGVVDATLEGRAGVAIEAVSSIVLALCLIGSAVYRYRRVSTPDQRRQTRWVLFGFMIGLPAFFAGDAMMRNIDGTPAGIACLFGFMILIPIGFNAPFLAVGSAMLFHRLFDIDVILGRTIVWLVMTLAVAGAYIGIVLGVGTLLGTGGSLVLSLLATGLVAVAFQPLRARVQRGVNRLLFGERDDPYAVLSRLGHRIEETVGAADLLSQIVRTAAEALRLPYVALFLDRTGGPELVASAGSVSPSTLRLPLVYQGQAIGALEVGQRSQGEVFNAADRRLLEDLARQIGIAAYTVNLAAEVQRSREQIVASREEERRRLRRDLHDGLGAQLAALIMQAGAIRAQVRTDPGASELALAELRGELKSAVIDVRRLVDGLRPPALDELGLVGALRARVDGLRAGRLEEDRPAVEVRLDAREPLPPLPAAVEVATVRIVEEAVTNALRHATASQVVVTVYHERETLFVSILDDGTGFDMHSVSPGIGLQSMRERARELGGTWTMDHVAGGTGCRIEVTLPATVPEP